MLRAERSFSSGLKHEGTKSTKTHESDMPRGGTREVVRQGAGAETRGPRSAQNLPARMSAMNGSSSSFVAP